MAAPELSELGGNSRAFKNILKRAETFCKTDLPILLLGPTGTGKTALAKWIHQRRYPSQKDRPFLHVNVSVLSKDTIDNELFGHEKGSYTGADQTKMGLFELANN